MFLTEKKQFIHFTGQPNYEMCMQVFNILYALADVSGVKDGDYFSLAKIDAASLFNDDLEILEAAANTNMDHCTFVDEKAVRYSLGPLKDLSDLIKYKEYDDGYKARQRSKTSPHAKNIAHPILREDRIEPESRIR